VDLAVNLSPSALYTASAVVIYAVVWALVFTESGLLIGFFLPGDTLLLAAGVAAHKGAANIAVLCAGCAVAAIVGDNVGYTIGRRAGRPLLEKRDGLVLNQENLGRATRFYERFGSPTIVLARFTPLVRTFAPLIAGATLMPYRRFFVWNVVGGVLWGVGLPLLAYTLGSAIPGFDKYAVAAVFVMVVLSIVPAALHYLRARRHRAKRLRDEQREVVEDARS
jgi:membrane-associated protein